jgi:hypothetical protein
MNETKSGRRNRAGLLRADETFKGISLWIDTSSEYRDEFTRKEIEVRIRTNSHGYNSEFGRSTVWTFLDPLPLNDLFGEGGAPHQKVNSSLANRSEVEAKQGQSTRR